MTGDSERCPNSGGCCQVRMTWPSTSSLHTSCSGANPAPAVSGKNTSDLFQHSVAVGYGLWKGFDPYLSILLTDFYCFLLLLSNSVNTTHRELFEILGPDIFFSDPYAKPPFRHLWCQVFTHCSFNTDGNIQKAAACPVTALHKFTHMTALRQLLLAAIKLGILVLAQKAITLLM